MKFGQHVHCRKETLHEGTGARLQAHCVWERIGHKRILEQYRVCPIVAFNLFQPWGAMLPKLATHWKRESGACPFLSPFFHLN